MAMIEDIKEWQMPTKRLHSKAGGVDHTVYWHNNHVSYEQSLFGAVSRTLYSPSGDFIAVVSQNQSLLLRVPAKNGAVFNEQLPRASYAMRFRDDEKMVLQCIDQRVTIRSLETSLERQLVGHTRPVRDALFVTRHTVVSSGDDNTVRLWDVAVQEEIDGAHDGMKTKCSTPHTDYVRTLDRLDSHTFVSGSYDHTVKMWDTRVGLSKAVGSTQMLNGPVQQVVAVPLRGSGSTHGVAVGSNDVLYLFDSRQLDAALSEGSHHTKAMTAVSYCPATHTIVTGGLDKRIRFVSLASAGSFEVAATMKMEEPVTSLSIHPNAKELAVGLNNGHIGIFSFDGVTEQQEDAGEMSLKQKREEYFAGKIKEVQAAMAQHKYQRALRTAVYTNFPDVIITTLNELQRRGALRVALSGHNDRAIVYMMRFCLRYMSHPETAAICIHVFDLILEIYSTAASRSVYFHKQLVKACKEMETIVERLDMMEKTLAVMDVISK